ncbi:hypothetical protein UlMin_034851, partial [Ulmus minor]
MDPDGRAKMAHIFRKNGRTGRHIEQILELNLEELLVKEVNDLHNSSDEDLTLRNFHCFSLLGRDHDVVGTSSGFTFNTCLASLYTYLGGRDDILNIPIFYLERLLFPRVTLPLRVIEPNFVATIERELTQVDAPYAFGVINRDNGRIKFSTIWQYRRLDDGSSNVISYGQQIFCLRLRLFDADGVPFGEIQIIFEDFSLRTPRDVLRVLAPYRSRRVEFH